MGTTQSKKRRKDVMLKKKKRGSVSYSDSMLPPRSVSMDVLHYQSVTASPSTSCPLCPPDSRFTASWSSDQSLSNSLCLHHAKMAQYEFGRDLDKTDGFDSCPECLQLQITMSKISSSPLSSSSSTHCQPHRYQQQLHHLHQQHRHHDHRHHQLCEISNQDFDEMSTMSLNRKISGRQSGNSWVDCNSNTSDKSHRSVGIVQSRSAEVGDFSHGPDVPRRHGQCSQTKENVNPVVYNYSSRVKSSEDRVVCGGENRGYNQTSWTSDGQLTLTEKLTKPRDFGQLVDSLPAADRSSSSVVNGNNLTTETKSNFSSLDDEEAVQSRWVRRKQMAQELRTLRLHLQREEDVRFQMNSTTSSQISPVSFKPYSFQSDHTKNIRVEKNTVNESFTSTTTQNVTKACSGLDTGRQMELSQFTKNSKNSISRNSSFNDASIPTGPDVSVPCDSTDTTAVSPSRRSIRSKFSKLSNYRYLDNHPVMTRLQNEQNNRLELMERRMEGIRISAMQEAERRRFAEIFPAKDDDSETQKLLREARESLERMKEEKRKKALCTKDQQQEYNRQHRYQFRATSAPPRSDYSQSHEDAGEIIPVIHVMSSSRETTPINSRNSKDRKKSRTVPEENNCNTAKGLWGQGDWPDINLGKPLTWLWLPFMLFPLVLRMLLAVLFNSTTPPTTPRNGNSVVSNTRWCHADGNRNIPRDKRKKSC